jgi:prevent-host-death family protein
MQIAAGQFKAKCLSIMDEIQHSHEEVLVTKFGKPLVRLIPYEPPQAPSVFGFLKGTVGIHGDIIASIDTHWEATECR